MADLNNHYRRYGLLLAVAASYLALVVNEMVQNALKHAFVGRKKGRVQVSLGSSPDAFIILIQDDGAGLSDDYRRGLGSEIVETLVCNELRGKWSMRNQAVGTEVSVLVPRVIQQIAA